MKMFVISDNVDTLTGMRLAGVDGVLAHTREEFSRALEAAVKDPSNGRREAFLRAAAAHPGRSRPAWKRPPSGFHYRVR